MLQLKSLVMFKGVHAITLNMLSVKLHMNDIKAGVQTYDLFMVISSHARNQFYWFLNIFYS